MAHKSFCYAINHNPISLRTCLQQGWYKHRFSSSSPFSKLSNNTTIFLVSFRIYLQSLSPLPLWEHLQLSNPGLNPSHFMCSWYPFPSTLIARSWRPDAGFASGAPNPLFWRLGRGGDQVGPIRWEGARRLMFAEFQLRCDIHSWLQVQLPGWLRPSPPGAL